MNQTRRKGAFPYPLAIPVALAVALAVLLLVAVSEIKTKKQSDPAELPALALLDAEADADPKEVERELKARRESQQAEMDASERESMRDELMSEIENAGDDVWSRFHDYAVLGDSRAVGFYYYRFLQSSRVFADGGDCIRDVKDHMDELRALDPSYIYLCYGLNDTGMGYWKTGEEYGVECREVLTLLKETFPEAEIVVSSILPATESAMYLNPVWRKIPAFSEAMREACEELNCAFADCAELADKYMDVYWESDGVHLNPDFYPYWAANLLLAQLAAEQAE
ncbi:MAG: hypothetical protein IK104_09430 [Clostridia bacterium]|nr:hypothetical protein [Clostridia bacterium]